LRIDEENRRESRIKTELILKLLVISSLSPHETNRLISEIINYSSDNFEVY
jgi:hypothetical protein